MTENKRFRIYQDLYEDFYIEDIESYNNQKLQRSYKVGNEEDVKYENVENIVDLLNEQSDKITEQAIQIDFLKDENKHMRQVLEENRQLKQFKELIYTVLKQEYEDRTNEMNRWAEKEDWNGYRATKLEYGTVIRIAKRIGVDLE